MKKDDLRRTKIANWYSQSLAVWLYAFPGFHRSADKDVQGSCLQLPTPKVLALNSKDHSIIKDTVQNT